jgi:hypothetical protein
MLMRVEHQLEPLARLRAAVPSTCQSTLNLLVGTVTLPVDQPGCATAVVMLANCLLEYSQQISFLRTEFAALLHNVSSIVNVVADQLEIIQGTQPRGQMEGRTSSYPAWSLLLSLTEEQRPLCVALGAEIALALLDQGQLNTRFCTQILRDSKKYGRPTLGQERDIQDLQEVGFGRGWLSRYQTIDRQVRRRVEPPDPKGPTRPDDANPHNRFDLLARLKWRFDYPKPKHRQGGLDDSHLTPAQFYRVASAVRQRVETGDKAALVAGLSILTGLTPELTTSLPLIHEARPLQILGVDVAHGCLVLDFRLLFPNRRRPSPETAALFHASIDLLVVPLPVFLAEELRRHMLGAPESLLLGDLVDWVKVGSRASLLTDENCKLVSSLARASKSTAAMAITTGSDRLVAACLTWDFSIVGSARMYYARLTGAEIHHGCKLLYSAIGWGDPAFPENQLAAVGSHCQLTDEGARQLFAQLARLSKESWPARRANFETLLVHHAHYARYCVALVSFNLGLREVDAYRLNAHELLTRQNQITMHDKQGGDRLMAQPVLLNRLVREQIRQYVGHCEALIERLDKLNTGEAASFVAAIRLGLRGQSALFLVRQARGGVRPAGAANTWGKLPSEFRVPGNSGRHFWQNVLRTQGLGSRDIDRFMRHRVVGLESNTSSQTASPRQSFERIDHVQCQVLHALGVSVVSGLRKV